MENWKENIDKKKQKSIQYILKTIKAIFGSWKIWGKENRVEKWRKIKNRFKINKLFVYVYLNTLYLFSSII